MNLSPPMAMPDLVWKFLSGRGIQTAEQIQNAFQPKLKNLAHPFSMGDMDVAVERLIKAFQGDENILIYGDYDLDGTPAVALLMDGLSRLGFKNLCFYQPSRTQEGYGFHSQVVEKYAAKGVSLIVTVDVGITDIESVNFANARDVDVIITDHHLPKDTLPNAKAILNPNKGNCASNLQHLCGTGVAFYLILALKIEMQKNKLLEQDFDPKELLDLFALATITDMVPLIRENRILVKHGLLQLAQTKRPGLKRLIGELGFNNKSITSQDVAFRIAPKLNALTRLDEGLRAIDVLVANEEQSSDIVDQLLQVNERRVNYQKKAKAVADQILSSAKQNKNFVWVFSKNIHPGVVSLVASDMMNQYGVPAFVGSLNDKGQIIGSARSPSEKRNLQNALGAAELALIKWGGHKLAAGFEIEVDKSLDFQNCLSEHFEKLNQGDSDRDENEFTPIVEYDVEAKLSEINATVLKWLDGLDPFGKDFPTPQILIRDMKVEKLKKLKGQFLKYTLSLDGSQIDALWFKGAKEFSVGSLVHAVVTPQWNDFNGRRTIQLLIHHMDCTMLR